MIRQISKLVSQLMSIVFKPRGRLNQDIDKRYLNNGDFLDSLNTRSITTLGGSTGDREIVDGNIFAWQLETAVLQNRIFIIAISSEASGTYRFSFFNANGGLMVTTVATAPTAGNINQTITDVINSITAALILAGASYAPITGTVITPTTAHIQVEITSVPYWEYLITSVGTADPTIFISQESVSADLLGEWRYLGGYDLEGEAYTWWTTRTGLPVTLDITAIANAGTLFQITTATPHNQVTGSAVAITGTTVADGNWIINVLDQFNFTLLGSVFVGGSTLGTVTTNVNGLGEVGHAVRNENTLAWTYVRLIRSKIFNFTTKHQIDTYCEKNALYKALYWTDDYNPPRVLYDRTVVYQNDVLLTFIDPLNTYSYLTLDAESKLMLSNTDFVFRWTSQSQTGGNIPAGNSRYVVRGITEVNTYTDWTFLDNPIPAAIADENGSGYKFFGNDPNTPTPKVNNFVVIGILLGVIKYLELAVVNYQGTAKTGWIVGRFLVTSNSMTIQHTGYEVATQDLDLGTIGVISKIYDTAKSIDSLDGHLILSNLTSPTNIDLTEYFEDMTYSINRKVLDHSTGSFIAGTLGVGDFMLSDAVYGDASLMLNERYRFGHIAEFINGSKSDVYFTRDIIVNTDNTQPGCTTALPSLDLTTAVTANPGAYTFYITFDTPNANMVINGVRVGDVVKRIYTFRCEVTNPQVLGSGILLPAVSGTVGNPGTSVVTWQNPADSTVDHYGEFPFPGGVVEASAPGIPPDYDYTGNPPAVVNFTQRRPFASMYIPDMFLGGRVITPQAGDIVYNNGQAESTRLLYADTDFNDYIIETNGNASDTKIDVLIDEGYNLGKGAAVTFTTGEIYSKYLRFDTLVFGIEFFHAPAGLVLHADPAGVGNFNIITANPERAMYNAQYFRAIATGDIQYGSKADSRYVWTGASIEINDATPATFDVFGGDVFTQRAWFKNRYPVVAGTPIGFGQGLGFYSQNRVNFQFRRNGNGTTMNSFPDTIIPTGGTNGIAQNWLNDINTEILLYNEGYTIRNEIENYAGFDVNNLVNITNDFPCRIIYSGKKVPESAQDSYRFFQVLNFKDLDYKYGEITSHLVINGELLTWQIDRFQRQFFNDTNMMTASGVEVILGDGAALQRRGIDLSTYGCSNKWSIFKGKSKGGKDTVYWIDAKRKLSIRFGYDGTVNISIIHGMDSWFQNRLRYIKDTPADGEGICGVWNERHKEAIWTVRGWKQGVEVWEEPFNVLHDFTTFGAFRPYSNVIEIDGILYGISFIGGASTYGYIYSYDLATDTYTNLFNLLLASGGNVIADIIAIGTVIYGVTSNGGASSSGVIFSYNTATNTYTNLKSFNGTTDGDTPSSGLLHISGVLYGVTYFGGSGTGTLFSYNIATTTFTVLQNLTVNSRSNLVNIGTILYGTSGANIFSFNLTGSVYTLIPLSAAAFAGLTLSGTTLYGTTEVGGTGNLGTIFSYDTVTATLTTLYNFSGVDGATPRASMILNGNYLVGTTNGGGVNSLGTIFVYNIITNTYQKIFDFTAARGSLPQSTLLFYNNVFYGTAADGGIQVGSDGTLFSFQFFGVGSVTQIGLTGFEQLPAFYQSLIDYNLSDPLTSDTWELVPFSNYEYYNVYTIVFNEITNGFDGFYSFKPKGYLAWRNTYLSPRPVSNEGSMYEHNRGLYAVFYDDDVTSQAGDGKFKFVINALPDELKKFYAVRFRTDITPARVDLFSSGGQQTFMLAADFEFREMNYDCSIRNNILTSSDGLSNDEDTGRLYGDLVEVELTLSFGIYQKMYFCAVRIPYVAPRKLQS